MISNETIEQRLRDWAKEYRGGRYENVGWHSKNILETLREHQGFMPDSQLSKRALVRTAADEVEEAIQELLRVNWKAGCVVRIEYLKADAPEQQKLDELRRDGLGMSRAHYYECLRVAYMAIYGYLRGLAAAGPINGEK